MDALVIWGYIFIIVFTLMIIGIGAASTRKAGQGTEQHYLGGRSLPPAVIAITYVTASTSAAIYMGEPGIGYQLGLPALWVSISIIPGMVIPALLLTSRLRKFSINTGSVTIPTYLGERYSSDALRVLLAVVILVFYILPIMAQFRGVSILFEVVLGIPNAVGLVIFAVVVGIYTALGGFRAVAWTDTAQAIPMVIFSVALVVISYTLVGGFSGLSTRLTEIDPALTNVFEPTLFTPWGVLGAYVFWMLIFASNPYLSTKFMAMRSSGKGTMLVFTLVTLGLTALLNLNYIIGLSARVKLPGLPNPDYATIEMATTYLHPAIAAFMMVGIIAAVMSTIDSILLVVGQAVGEDIYRKTINPNASEHTVVWITRATIVVVTLIVLILSLLRTPELLAILLFIGLTGVGIAIGPPLIVGLFWEKATKWGALASTLVAVPLYSYLIVAVEMSFYTACLIGAVAAFSIMILVSLFTTPPSEEVLNRLKETNT